MSNQPGEEVPLKGERRRRRCISTRLLWLLAGAGFGAAAAFLFNPKSGEEWRNDIADATRKGIDRSKEAAQQLGAKATEYYGASQETRGDLGGEETKEGY